MVTDNADREGCSPEMTVLEGADGFESPAGNSGHGEGEGRDNWKSEVSIVAVNAGNAVGAKGHRFEIVNRGNMPRHRADNKRMSTQLIHFTQWAREAPQPRYTALMGM